MPKLFYRMTANTLKSKNVSSIQLPVLPPKQCALFFYKHREAGFTLVELIIALALGLLISTAALQLFISSANSQRVQAGVADTQDAAVFSLNYIKKEIATANLGSGSTMTQTSPWTGVVLTGSIDTKNSDNKLIKSGNLRGMQHVDDAWLTRSQAGPTNVKATDSANNHKETRVTTRLSDQLTIQYRAPFDSRDCEGNKVNQGDMVIERFFTRTDNQKESGETNDNNLAIVLACDAGTYTPPINAGVDNITKDSVVIKKAVKNRAFGGGGSVLVNRVEDFEVKLGVRLANGATAYVTIDDYLSKGNGDYSIKAPIVAIQLGVLIRGNNTVTDNPRTTYTINGDERTIDNSEQHYPRRVYQTIVALRNNAVAL